MTSQNRLLSLLSPYLLALLVLVLAELGLREWYPALDNPLTNNITYDGIEWYQVNRSYLKKYFPSNTPLVPEFKTTLFRRRKLANTFRVFCLGESSMFGTPYQMTCNIPGIVRKQLRHLYPGKEIEVVNWGASAINTNVIADLAKTLVRLQPDLILVYTGHNEFYGPDGVGASFIENEFPFTIPLKYHLRDLRLAAVIFNALGDGKTTNGSANLNLMEQVSRGNTVPLRSEVAERIFELYRRNLGNIIETFTASHIPLIISDVSSNLTFPPFISDSLSTVQQQALASCKLLYGSGRYEEAAETMKKLARTDSTNAMIDFWLGKAELAIGQSTDARRHLLLARDNDLLKFRAPSRINQITREVCGEKGVPFVSADSLLAALENTGIAGDDFFWEHLHPTARGYYWIATMFVQEIVRLGLLENDPSFVSQTQLLPFDVDSLSICWLDRAYGDLSIQHLTGRWPFVNYHRTPWVLDSADLTMKQIAGQVYQRKVVWEDACYRIAAYFWEQGKMREAQTTYEAMLEEYPYSFYTHYLMGSLLNQQHNLPSALAHYRRSIELNPRFPNSRLDVGLIEINEGDFDQALKDLSEALEAAGNESTPQLRAGIHYGLSAVYANKGDLNKALEEIDTSLKLQPGSRDAVALRTRIVQAQN